jgi:hypothetical protein
MRFHNLAFRIEMHAASAGGIRPPSDLQWILENFSSLSQLPDTTFDLDRDPPTRCDGIVVLHRYASVYQALFAQRELYTQAVPCFSMHGDRVATLANPSAPEIIYDSELEVFYQVAPKSTTTFDPAPVVCVATPEDSIPRVLVVANENQPSARIAILRILREIASQRMLAAGWVPMHAAAVTSEDRSILILGERRAGKSTLMLQLLLEHECDFLANDRVWIDVSSPDGPQVYSIPCIINIRASSLALFTPNSPTTTPPLPLCNPLCRTWRARETLDETMTNPRSLPQDHQSADLSLSPRQFLHLVQRNQVSNALATMFLFPSISDEKGFDVQRLTPEQCQTKLRENLFPMAPSEFSKSTARDSTFEDSLAKLAKSIGAFALRIERGRRLSKEDVSSVLRNSLR